MMNPMAQSQNIFRSAKATKKNRNPRVGARLSKSGESTIEMDLDGHKLTLFFGGDIGNLVASDNDLTITRLDRTLEGTWKQ
jgi:hypothetical protein